MLYCGDNYQHWVTTCFMEGQVMLYDSLGKAKATLTPELKRQIIELYGTTAGDGGDLNILQCPKYRSNLERVTADVLQLLGLCTSLTMTSLKL